VIFVTFVVRVVFSPLVAALPRCDHCIFDHEDECYLSVRVRYEV
jgi:hypothetical protein